jgi:hypothetical protein
MRVSVPAPFLLAALVLALTACGGGSGSDPEATPFPTPGPAPTPGPEDPTGPPGSVPQVVLLGVGGHSPIGQAATYLETSALPWLEGELTQAGYTVETHGFVDGGDATKGFPALLARLQAVRDAYVTGQATPSRVILLAHSHGGPWAHAATRDVPDCPIRCLVDLDTNSYGWSLTHTPDNALLGGSPDDAYTIPVNVNPPAYPTITSEPGFLYDLEDVVFPSVRDALEVVTAELVPNLANPLQWQRYDTRWNARLDGTLTGLTPLYVLTLHAEPVLPPAQGGTTLPQVRDWILARLATP